LPNTGDDIADALDIDPEDVTFGEDDEEKPTTENQEDSEPENGELEDGEPGEPEDGEPEDSEPEDSEPEDGEPVNDETNDVDTDETDSADAEAEAIDNEATGAADDKDTEPLDPAGDKNTDPVEADDGEGTDPIEDADTFDSPDGENTETTKEDIEEKIGTSIDGNPLDDETPLEKVDNEDVADAVDDFDDDATDDSTDVKDKDDIEATTENPDDVDEFGFGAGDDDRLGSDDETIPEDPEDSDSEDSQPEDGEPEDSEPEDSEPENGEPDEDNTSTHDDVGTEIDETTPTDADEPEATDDEETPNGSHDEDSEYETVTDSTDSDGEGAENGDIYGEEEFAEPEIDDTLNEDQPSDDNLEELETGEGAAAADDIFRESTDGSSTDAEENKQDDLDDAPGSNVGNSVDEEGTAPTHYSGHNSDSDKFEAELPATDVDSTGFGATRPTTTTSSGHVKYQGALLIAGIGIVGLLVVKRSRETIVQVTKIFSLTTTIKKEVELKVFPFYRL
jgi:hypothetical protein